tara:strand:- start:113 stop:709 length:597 start_codon:yes stop_codon:yes gene_type:complete
MHSLYEIETTVKRSAKAQGLSWGVSEEIGKAIRVLEQAEMGGLEAFNRLIEKGLNNLIKFEDINQKDKNNLCPIHFGLFYLDQSHKKNIHKEIKIDELIEPLITLPFLCKAAKKNLVYFQFNHKKLKLSISPSDLVSLSNENIPNIINNFSLKISSERKINYSKETWNKLYKLSLETFVEETEEKKLSGAGAGLTDND